MIFFRSPLRAFIPAQVPDPHGDAEISHYKTNRKSDKQCNYVSNLDESMKITKSMKGIVLYVLSFTWLS